MLVLIGGQVRDLPPAEARDLLNAGEAKPFVSKSSDSSEKR